MQKMAYQLREAKGERAKAESQLLKKDAEIEDLKKQLAELARKLMMNPRRTRMILILKYPRWVLIP